MLPNRSILHIGGVTFSSNFCFAETVSRFGQRWKIQTLGLDIKTGFKTLDSWVFISRLESIFLKFEAVYWDWNRDSQILSLVIETEINTFEIRTLVSKLVSRLQKNSHCKSHCWSLVCCSIQYTLLQDFYWSVESRRSRLNSSISNIT